MDKIVYICIIIGCLIVITGCVHTPLGNNSTIKITPTPTPAILTIKYFKTQNCPLCYETDLLIQNLSKQYPNQLKITELGLTNEDNRAIYAMYTKNIKVDGVPFMVINERIPLVNYTQIATRLEPMLKGEERS